MEVCYKQNLKKQSEQIKAAEIEVPIEVDEYQVVLAHVVNYELNYPLKRSSHWLFSKRQDQFYVPFTTKPLDVMNVHNEPEVVKALQ